MEVLDVRPRPRGEEGVREVLVGECAGEVERGVAAPILCIYVGAPADDVAHHGRLSALRCRVSQ